VHLTVAPEAAKVELGGRVILSLTIQNAGSMTRRFRIDVSGIPKDWYDLDQPCASRAPVSKHLSISPAHCSTRSRRTGTQKPSAE
jgi:hypothetical protein